MRNQLIVQNAELAINQMKEEIAAELGIKINPDMKSRDAGRIGGEITKRLIELGKHQLMEISQEQGIGNVELTKYIDNQGNPPTYDQLH